MRMSGGELCLIYESWGAGKPQAPLFHSLLRASAYLQGLYYKFKLRLLHKNLTQNEEQNIQNLNNNNDEFMQRNQVKQVIGPGPI